MSLNTTLRQNLIGTWPIYICADWHYCYVKTVTKMYKHKGQLEYESALIEKIDLFWVQNIVLLELSWWKYFQAHQPVKFLSGWLLHSCYSDTIFNALGIIKPILHKFEDLKIVNFLNPEEVYILVTCVVYRWIDRQMDGWINGWIDGLMDAWMHATKCFSKEQLQICSSWIASSFIMVIIKPPTELLKTELSVTFGSGSHLLIWSK